MENSSVPLFIFFPDTEEGDWAEWAVDGLCGLSIAAIAVVGLLVPGVFAGTIRIRTGTCCTVGWGTFAGGTLVA